MKPILFVHVPKAAGSTIYKSFNLERVTKHATLNYLQIKDEIDVDGCWIIGTVRNPWQRIFSLWNWTCSLANPKHGLDWKEWLYDSPLVGYHYRDELNNNPLKQVNYFIDMNGKIKYNEIIRAEHLEKDVWKSTRLNGVSTNHYAGGISGTSIGWRDHYDEEDVEYVREQSKWEIDTFGYKFEETE